MSWAQRRQFTYLFSFLAIVAAIVYVVVRNATHVAPTCYDGKRNGGEVGVDCGGACTFYCKDELAEPKVRWYRYFDAAPGLVHAIAYVEHSYPTAGARQVGYQFTVYDEKNTEIAKRVGKTYLGPMGRTALVETLIPVGNVAPALVRFSFTDEIPWEKIPVAFSQVVIKTDKYLVENFSGGTRLTAQIENQSRIQFEDVDVVAVLYDKDDNALAISKSLIETLPTQGNATVYFTWPNDLTKNIVRVEILPRINPFNAR